MAELYLRLSEIERLIADAKENLQREVNQGVRKHSPDGQIQSLNALGGIEALENFFYSCRLRAGEFAPVTEEKRSQDFEALKKPRLAHVGKRFKKEKIVRMGGR